MILRSLLYGYAGAIVAGLLVGIVGFVLELSQETIVSTSLFTGISFGLIGLSIPFLTRLYRSKTNLQ